MSKTHLASCGSIDDFGRRLGTRYAYTPRAVWAISAEPWFRFRNAESENICRKAWSRPAPCEGEYFTVATEPAPDAAWCTRVSGELTRCTLAAWEVEGHRGASLHRLGDSDFYRAYQRRADYAWHPVGRVLKLNERGRATCSQAEERA
jgi:hypothetical protein